MIEPSTLALYTLGALVIIVAPGPDFIYVTTRGIAQGRKAGMLSATGISIGLLIHTMLAAFGLSALLQTSELAFQVVKYAGAAYLIYLGIKTLLNKESFIHYHDQSAKLEEKSVLRQGVLTNVFNPKAVLTFMAFIPQFINPAEGNAAFQIILLGLIIALLAILWFGLIGYFAGSVGTWLSRQILFQKTIRWITGAILLGLGIRLAVAGNR